MKKLFMVILSAFFLLSGCTSEAKDKLESIKKSGKLVMYTNAEFPPFEFMEDNKIVGVDVEIGEAIAAKLGVTLEIKNAEFDGIVASIASGKGDVAISGITINETRLQEVDFSIPYVDSVQYIIIKEDSDLQFVEDFAGKELGVQIGTTGAMLIDEEITDDEKGVLYGKGSNMRTYNSAPTAMQDLIAGRISAVVIDELVALAISNENPGYKAIPLKYESGSPFTEQFGVAVQKGNENLLKIINDVIDDMVKNGKIDEAIEKYSE